MVKEREKKVTCFSAEPVFSVIQSQERVADGWWASCPPYRGSRLEEAGWAPAPLPRVLFQAGRAPGRQLIMLVNEESSPREERGGAGCGPITSKPLDISWENDVILAFHALVKLKFQLPEN